MMVTGIGLQDLVLELEYESLILVVVVLFSLSFGLHARLWLKTDDDLTFRSVSTKSYENQSWFKTGAKQLEK